MNNEKFEKLIRSMKSVRLNADEKAQMFQNIRFAVRERAAQKPERSVFSLRMLFVNKISVAALCAVLVIVSSVGVSKAAQNSLPGDFLYPVKVNITEKIKAALAHTPEQKAKVETGIAVQRLQEAEALQAQNKLDAQKSAEITQNLAEHAQKIQKEVTNVQNIADPKTVQDLNQQLDSSLGAHTRMLQHLSEHPNSDQSQFNAILDLRQRAEHHDHGDNHGGHGGSDQHTDGQD